MRSGKEVTSLSLAEESLDFTDKKCAVFRNWERNSNCRRLYLRKAQSVSDGPSCYGHKIRLNNFFQKNCKPSLIMKLRNKKLFKTFIVSCVAVTWLWAMSSPGHEIQSFFTSYLVPHFSEVWKCGIVRQSKDIVTLSPSHEPMLLMLLGYEPCPALAMKSRVSSLLT